MIIQTNTFMIRPIKEDEMTTVLEVYRQCEDFLALTPKPIASMEIVKEDLALSQQNNGLFCGIYNLTGEMMGIADVVLKGFEGDPSVAFIELVMIAQPYRGSGLGSKVVEVIESEIARDSTVKTILLEVMVNNPAAIHFWQRHGYKQSAGPLPEPDGTTVWRYNKPIFSQP